MQLDNTFPFFFSMLLCLLTTYSGFYTKSRNLDNTSIRDEQTGSLVGTSEEVESLGPAKEFRFSYFLSMNNLCC